MNDKSSKVLHKLQSSNQGETNVIERTDQEMKSKNNFATVKTPKRIQAWPWPLMLGMPKSANVYRDAYLH